LNETTVSIEDCAPVLHLVYLFERPITLPSGSENIAISGPSGNLHRRHDDLRAQSPGLAQFRLHVVAGDEPEHAHGHRWSVCRTMRAHLLGESADPGEVRALGLARAEQVIGRNFVRRWWR
jgi:hypothetical protein